MGSLDPTYALRARWLGALIDDPTRMVETPKGFSEPKTPLADELLDHFLKTPSANKEFEELLRIVSWCSSRSPDPSTRERFGQWLDKQSHRYAVEQAGGL